MKKLFLCMMLITTAYMVFAQTTPVVTYTIKGVLLDSLSQEGEPYATIRIVKKEAPTKSVKLAVTDTNGKFQEQITGSGNYVMSITSIGKLAVVKEFTLKPENKTMDLGIMYTGDDANQLAEVEVVAQKPLVKVDIDKIEYNIEDDPDSKTNTVLEMLRKVPLVTVDGEDNIQVNGSSSFKVHVNGKPNSMMSNNPTEVLKSMPANTIKHIEVITNPGAKYDAEGVGGILNIVTIGGGFEGYTVTLGANVNNTGAGGNAYGTVQKGKLTVTGNYALNYYDSPKSYSNGEKTFKGEITGTEKTESTSKNSGNYQFGNVEASYEVDTLRLISLGFGVYGNGGNYKRNGFTDFPDNYYYTTRGRGDNSWLSLRGNIDYQRMFKLKGRMLTFSYRLNTQPQSSDGHTYYEDRDIEDAWKDKIYIQDQRSDGKTNTTEHTLQADYVTPIGKLHTVETGFKYINRNNTSDTKYYDVNGNSEILNNNRSVDYKHLNNIFAAYGGYSLRYKNLSGKVGVRYERTMLDVEYKSGLGDDFDKSYNDVVPSASIGYKIGQTKNIRGGYNMRIWRPSIYFLNPYRDLSNPTNIRFGNPNLDTEKSHSFNIGYSSFTSKFNLNLTLRHSFTNNSIEEYIFKENNILNTTFENIGKTRNTGMSAYVNWNASPKTRIYINANGGYNVYKSEKQGLENDGWDLFMYGGIQHTLPHEIRVSLNLMGATSRTTLQGKRDGFTNYGFNINKAFLNKRLTLTAFANNVFSGYRKSKSTTTGPDFDMTNNNEYPHRRFGISVSYRIGELKAQVKKAARSIQNDDVKGGSEGGSEGGGEGGGGN